MFVKNNTLEIPPNLQLYLYEEKLGRKFGKKNKNDVLE